MIGNEPWGSSPRVRGSLSALLVANAAPGIIPAGAGLTHTAGENLPAARDHPRGCGAHYLMRSAVWSDSGSSPRVRGSRTNPPALIRHPGIIPAGAGLTVIVGRQQHEARDHPRGCGAHAAGRKTPLLWMGSSPRVRGSLRQVSHYRPFQGIIPAGAGLTMQGYTRYRAGRDHPRGCGAHMFSTSLPPHV